jgi:hypothetical protein
MEKIIKFDHMFYSTYDVVQYLTTANSRNDQIAFLKKELSNDIISVFKTDIENKLKISEV